MLGKAEAGRVIKRARERHRWTQAQLAEALGVDRKTVDNWENGRRSPRSSAGAIEDVLGINLDTGDTVVHSLVQSATVPEAIDADPVLSDDDRRALKRHYYGLVQFAEKRRELEHLAGGLSPPDPPEGRDPPTLSPHPAKPEPAND